MRCAGTIVNGAAQHDSFWKLSAALVACSTLNTDWARLARMMAGQWLELLSGARGRVPLSERGASMAWLSTNETTCEPQHTAADAGKSSDCIRERNWRRNGFLRSSMLSVGDRITNLLFNCFLFCFEW